MRSFILIIVVLSPMGLFAQLVFDPVDKFSSPVGKEQIVTERKDGDGWYNANDFKQGNHLGEDWNAETGGNSDCGNTIYAVANGIVVFSKDVGGGWGEVVIIRHELASGEWIETQYAHLLENLATCGMKVTRKQPIGTIGDGAPPCGDSSPYYAHLHFEMRLSYCADWGQVGPGYSAEDEGWTDPSEFMGDYNAKSGN